GAEAERHPVLAQHEVYRHRDALRGLDDTPRDCQRVPPAEFDARDVRERLKVPLKRAAYPARPRIKSNRVLDAGREAESLELFGDVARRLFRAGRARAAAFELVGGEVGDVRAQALRVGGLDDGVYLLRDGYG